MQQYDFKREVSVLHGVMLLVGCVIGAGAFILVGPLANQTGPGLWIAYVLAAIPATFVAFIFALLGSAFPITGATYIALSRVISPMVGSVVLWCSVLGVFLFTLPMMAYGFAVYLRMLVPVPLAATALGVLVFFTVLNIVGMKLTLWVQSISTILTIAGLLLVGIGGLFYVNPSYQTPLLPNGFSAILLTVVPAYVMFTGLNSITELAGEIQNPRKNIPVIIFISLALVVLVYVSSTYSLTGLLPWQTLGGAEGAGAVAAAAAKFLPSPFSLIFISVAALMAAATTINAGLTILSRDVLVLSQDSVLPSAFNVVHKRLGTPVWAILFLGVLSIIGLVIAGFMPEQFLLRCATMTSYVFMLLALVACITMYLLPRKMPDIYRAAAFKIGKGWLAFLTIGGAILFSGLIIAGCLNDPPTALYFVALIATGVLYYLIRRWHLRKRGIVLEDKLKKIDMFQDH